MSENKKIILWEYDSPLILNDLLNYEAGIWFWTMTPNDIIVTDDKGNTGYYSYKNSTIYNVQSLLIDGVAYSLTTSLADCRLTNQSFYYDRGTTKIYIHFDDFEPPLNKIISVGAATGFSWGKMDNAYYNNDYYEPRIKKIFPIKKNKDPLYYGLLKFITGKVEAINNDGFFDDWKDRNLFAQATRILIGQNGDDYKNLTKIFSGFIEDDSTDFEDFSVTLQDIRAGLTQPIATNYLTLTDYPHLDDSNENAPKPIAYGNIYNAPCICLNEAQAAATYTFLLCDTEFNAVSATGFQAYVDGIPQTGTLNAAAGTFTLPSSVYSPGDEVTANFVIPITNGVDIIKDLILNYDSKPFLASFWDLTEVNTAEALSRNTSLYIDDDTKLSECIEKVCFDIDALFFAKDDSRYTIRIFDEDREPVKTIKCDEWIDDPSVENEGSQYLTKAIIKYKRNKNDDTYLQYVNESYRDSAFSIYKRDKVETFETGLYTEADALAKSQTILDYSSNIPNVISRSVTFYENKDLEIMDFVICVPYSREGMREEYGVYEIIGLQKDIEKNSVKLTMRFIEEYTLPVDAIYTVLIDEAGNFIVDESGNYIVMR